MPDPVFKPCLQNQPMLFPPNLSDMIADGSMVRAVGAIIDSLEHKKLYDLYPGGGLPSALKWRGM